MELLHESLVLRVVLGFRVQEVVAARYDVDAFPGKALPRRSASFQPGQHEVELNRLRCGHGARSYVQSPPAWIR